MRYIALLFVGLFALPLQATVDVDLFYAEIIQDLNAQEEEKAIRQAGFEQVIVKATGDKSSINDPVIKKASSQSHQYLSQISRVEQQGQLIVKMHFSATQIRALLTQAGLPYWSNPRASLLLWVVEETPYGRDILWEQSGHALIEQVKSIAKLRGLPVTVPVGDMADITSITAPELWGGFVAPIGSVSERYDPDAVLVVQVEQSSDNIALHWALYDEKPAFMATSNRAPMSGEARGSSMQALAEVVDKVSRYYASKSATRSEAQVASSHKVKFVSLANGSSYFTLEAMLARLNSVASVSLEQIRGDEAIFRVHLIGSVDEFEREVVQSGHVRQQHSAFVEQTLPYLGGAGNDPASPEAVIDDALDTDTGAPVDQVQGNGSQNSTAELVADGTDSYSAVNQEQRNTLVFEWIKEK